jgi:hypothetical protein
MPIGYLMTATQTRPGHYHVLYSVAVIDYPVLWAQLEECRYAAS